jgi:hypothetical protein
MRKLPLFLAIAVGTCIGSGATQKHSETPIPLCRLLSEAEMHDEMMVTVSGIYLRGEHGAVLTDTGCDNRRPFVNLRRTPQYDLKSDANRRLVSLLKKSRAVRVTLSGEFHVAPKGQTFGPTGESYELEMTAILSATPAEDPAEGPDAKH